MSLDTDSARAGRRIRFDRNELAGAFGDIGTDLPLLIGMILASGIDVASTIIVFGLLQVLSGLVYRIPMPIQPLKAVAALVITQKIAGPVIYGAGLAIGLIMLALTLSGLLGLLGRLIPKPVVRGIQLGLGVKLSLLALGNYVVADGVIGYVLAAVAFVIVLCLLGNRRYPPALIVIALGIVYALAFKWDTGAWVSGFGFALPRLHVPLWSDILQGFLILALPQIPLSLGNSIYATSQMTHDLFPARRVTPVRIGLTYSLMNIAAPFLSGVPVCHGSGGLAGHYAFGARTGGSVILYGLAFLAVGLCFSGGFAGVVGIFPLPILGVILLFEGLTLMCLMGDTTGSRLDLFVALLTGIIAAGLPNGFLIGLIVGTVVVHASRRYDLGLKGP